MPAPLSVIIPTLNAAGDLPATCDALLGGVTDGLIGELILSDGGSEDGIAKVADALGAVLITGPRGRGQQIRRGVAAATGPWLLILHADTHLSDGWSEAVRMHMNQHPEMAGWFRLQFRAKGFAPWLISYGANLRSRHLGLPYGDQGLLVNKTTLETVGGIPDIPLMEDVVLAKRLKRRLIPLPATARTSAKRYEKEGWWTRSFANLTTLTRFMIGVRPDALAARYHRKDR